MIPAHILGEEWLKKSFYIPSDKDLRAALLDTFERYTHIGVIHMPQHAQTKKRLLACIAALEAYDAAMNK